MEHLNPFAVLPDSRGGISAALRIVGGVEQQPNGARVGRAEHRLDFIRPFTGAVHVMVIDERHARVTHTAAQRRQQPAEPSIVIGNDRTTGIIWSSHPTKGDASENTVRGTLHAMDASMLKELWNSDENSADALGFELTALLKNEPSGVAQ